MAASFKSMLPSRVPVDWSEGRSCPPSAPAQQGRARRETTVICNHAEAGHEGDIAVGHLASKGGAGHLANSLDKAEKAAGATSLTYRELAAAGIVRASSVDSKGIGTDEFRGFALFA